jgi:hypothetical protein
MDKIFYILPSNSSIGKLLYFRQNGTYFKIDNNIIFLKNFTIYLYIYQVGKHKIIQ